MLQNHRYGIGASRGVPVYAPAYAGTKYCLVKEAHGCEQLAQNRYAATLGRGSNSRPLDRKSDVLPLRHDVAQWWLELLEITDLKRTAWMNWHEIWRGWLRWRILPCPQFSKQSSNFSVIRKRSKPSTPGVGSATIPSLSFPLLSIPCFFPVFLCHEAAPLNRARVSGGARWAPPCGHRRSPFTKRFKCDFEWKNRFWL